MEKNLQLDRLVFFCDAVVAIAITLLVFNLKLDHLPMGYLTFTDLGGIWPKLLAFFVSFVNIAIFWTIHHSFFSYIKKIDTRLLRYNFYWLFFIVTIPFTASIISSFFSDTPAMFVYTSNVFMVTFFQKRIWNYVALHPGYLKEDTHQLIIRYYRLSCNIAMYISFIAIGISLISPLGAFIFLSLRLPTIAIVRKVFKTDDPITS